MEIVNICTINFLNNTIQCKPEKSCCPNNRHKQIWETWYVWFGLAIVTLFVVTSITTYLANICKKKQQNLIRIRNLSHNSGSRTLISTISGPGGIIQPNIRRFSNQVGAESSTSVPVPESSSREEKVNKFAEPLSPPYPPVEPVTIIRGSAPPQGYRQTDSYTEIVLPPGYIDSDHYKP